MRRWNVHYRVDLLVTYMRDENFTVGYVDTTWQIMKIVTKTVHYCTIPAVQFSVYVLLFHYQQFFFQVKINLLMFLLTTRVAFHNTNSILYKHLSVATYICTEMACKCHWLKTMKLTKWVYQKALKVYNFYDTYI